MSDVFPFFLGLPFISKTCLPMIFSPLFSVCDTKALIDVRLFILDEIQHTLRNPLNW